MGGDLRVMPKGAKAPSFMVYALRDPIGANLDRIQIVKGWLDADGTTHEKVYDVAWSDTRVPGADGKLPPVGNTVDVANANWTNTIGAAELATVWTDPEFDPAQKAFYYARVLEIPTPRWSTYDAFRLASTCPRARRPRLRSGPTPHRSGTHPHPEKTIDMKHLARLLREPLLHFFVFGGLIFLLFVAVSGPRRPRSRGYDRHRARAHRAAWERDFRRSGGARRPTMNYAP